jgi:hypothetical protein
MAMVARGLKELSMELQQFRLDDLEGPWRNPHISLEGVTEKTTEMFFIPKPYRRFTLLSVLDGNGG